MNEYVVVSNEYYGPENIVTTVNDLLNECENRGLDYSSLNPTPLKEWLESGRKAYNYAYVWGKGPRKGQFKSAEDLAKE